MTNHMNRPNLLATAAAVPLLPVVAHGAGLPHSAPEASAASAARLRARLWYAAGVLEIPEAQIAPLAAMPDAELVNADGLIDLCQEHGLSLDWLLFEDMEPMMRGLAAHRTAGRRDPAVAAYQRWLEARQEWRDYCEANEHRWVRWDDEEKDAGVQARTEAEYAAGRALEETAPTTPAGAAALVCYFLDTEGILVAPADPATLPELEDAGFNYVNGATVVRSLLAGLRQMASDAA